MRKVVEANHVEEGLLRSTLTAGERPTTRGIATITTRSLPEIPTNPALHISNRAKRLSGPLSQCKSISRVAESVALREANEEGAFDAILLNESGRVSETTSRNVFLVVDGGLWTPPTYDGALAGVTRALVMQIARREKIRVKEASVSVPNLRSAKEVVITGSGVGVLGIASIDGHRFDAPGPVTQRLRTAYESALETESRW